MPVTQNLGGGGKRIGVLGQPVPEILSQRRKKGRGDGGTEERKEGRKKAEKVIN